MSIHTTIRSLCFVAVASVSSIALAQGVGAGAGVGVGVGTSTGGTSAGVGAGVNTGASGRTSNGTGMNTGTGVSTGVDTSTQGTMQNPTGTSGQPAVGGRAGASAGGAIDAQNRGNSDRIDRQRRELEERSRTNPQPGRPGY